MVNLFIRSFAKIDDVKMEYSVQITFRQKWSDDRLTYKHRLTKDMESKSFPHNFELWSFSELSGLMMWRLVFLFTTR